MTFGFQNDNLYLKLYAKVTLILCVNSSKIKVIKKNFSFDAHQIIFYKKTDRHWLTTSDNEWYNDRQQMTTRDNEWQLVEQWVTTSDTDWCRKQRRVRTSGTTNHNKWQPVTTNNSKWYNESQRVKPTGTTSDKKWQRVATTLSKWEQVKERDFRFQNEINDRPACWTFYSNFHVIHNYYIFSNIDYL